MTIYIDVVILENLIMNYIILYATTIIVKKKLAIFRVLISSLLRCNLCNSNIHISKSNIFINNFNTLIINSNGIYSTKSQNYKRTIKTIINILYDFIRIWWRGAIFNIFDKTTTSTNKKWKFFW